MFVWLDRVLVLAFIFLLGNFSAAQHLQVDGQAVIVEMDTVYRSPNNLVRFDDGTLGIKLVQIGDTAYGGIVFYVDPSGEHGLVMAESDLSDAIAWSDTLIETGATGTGLLSGAMNTSIIIAAIRAGDYAAKLCLELDQGGYGDWYLPSWEELVLIQNNLHAQGIGNLKDGVGDFYWSSTETNLTFVRAIHFGDETIHGFSKTNPLHKVRAVRRF